MVTHERTLQIFIENREAVVAALTEEEEPSTLNAGPPPVPMPESELAVYAGSYFTLLLPNELMQIVLTHMDAWKANQEQLIISLRLCKGLTSAKTDAPGCASQLVDN